MDPPTGAMFLHQRQLNDLGSICRAAEVRPFRVTLPAHDVNDSIEDFVVDGMFIDETDEKVGPADKAEEYEQTPD